MFVFIISPGVEKINVFCTHSKFHEAIFKSDLIRKAIFSRVSSKRNTNYFTLLLCLKIDCIFSTKKKKSGSFL